MSNVKGLSRMDANGGRKKQKNNKINRMFTSKSENKKNITFVLI